MSSKLLTKRGRPLTIAGMKALPVVAIVALVSATAGAVLTRHHPAAQPAGPFVAPLFNDGMVLQRDRPDPIWGWTYPGARVTVKVGDETRIATADPGGRWQTTVGPLPVGTGLTISIIGSQSRTIHDVAVGDVFLCAGQSNMEFGMALAAHGREDAAKANDPGLRLVQIDPAQSLTPQKTVGAHWTPCTPANLLNGRGMGGFSAVAYYMGSALRRRHPDVPIGLIQCAVGATKADTWISSVALATIPGNDQARTLLARSQPGGQMTEVKPGRWMPIKNDLSKDTPTGHWNAMVAPIAGYGITSVVWYQGEADAGEAWLYRRNLTALVTDWRRSWRTDVPFVIVQLPDYSGSNQALGWASVQQSEAAVAQQVPNCVLVRTVDLGKNATAHPPHKELYGLRIASALVADTGQRQ